MALTQNKNSFHYEISANENTSSLKLNGDVNLTSERPTYELNGIFTDLNLKSSKPDYPFLCFSAVNARKITRTIDTIVPIAIQIVAS